MSLVVTPPTSTQSAKAKLLPIEVWAVGPWHDAEFALAIADLPEHGRWTYLPDCTAAVQFLTTEAEILPELLLLAQPLPGHYAQAQIAQLQHASPLTRIVVVAGSWCEGEVRTGKPLATVARLYWYELNAWWKTAQSQIAQEVPPAWSQPADAALAGRNSTRGLADQANSLGLIAVDCLSLATFETIAAALKPAGGQCLWTRDVDYRASTARLAAGIWDGGQLDPTEIPQLQRFAQQVRQQGGHTIALLDFPRWEHVETASQCGCQYLLGKPFIVSELITLLRP